MHQETKRVSLIRIILFLQSIKRMQECLKYKQQLLSCQLLFGSFFAWFGSSSFGSLGFCGLLDRGCLAGFSRTSQTSPLLEWFLCPSRFLSRLSICPLRLWLLGLYSSFRADLKWSRCSSAFGLNQATAGHQSLHSQFDARIVSYNIITTGSQSFLQSDQRDATALLWRWQDLEDQIRHAGSWLLGLGPSSCRFSSRRWGWWIGWGHDWQLIWAGTSAGRRCLMRLSWRAGACN